MGSEARNLGSMLFLRTLGQDLILRMGPNSLITAYTSWFVGESPMFGWFSLRFSLSDVHFFQGFPSETAQGRSVLPRIGTMNPSSLWRDCFVDLYGSMSGDERIHNRPCYMPYIYIYIVYIYIYIYILCIYIYYSRERLSAGFFQ